MPQATCSISRHYNHDRAITNPTRLNIESSFPGREVVRLEEGVGRRPHRLLAHREPDQGRDQGLQVQDEGRLRSLPHQLRHLRGRKLGENIVYFEFYQSERFL